MTLHYQAKSMVLLFTAITILLYESLHENPGPHSLDPPFLLQNTRNKFELRPHRVSSQLPQLVQDSVKEVEKYFLHWNKGSLARYRQTRDCTF